MNKTLLIAVSLFCVIFFIAARNNDTSDNNNNFQDQRPEFSSQKLTDNTFLINNSGAYCYLLLGEKEAIVIDAGMSRGNIRVYAQSLTSLPVSAVINTHSHFDHTAGNGFFDIIYATEGISRSAKNTMGGNPANYPLNYSFTIIKDGDIIKLEGRPLQIIELDCHSPGNIAILDATNGMLFPGDELEKGQVLLLPGYAEQKGQIHAHPAATVERYLAAMKKLNSFRNQFNAIYPGHNGTPITTDYLDDYIELAQRILDGYEGKKDCSNGSSYNSRMGHFPNENANYRRGEWKKASLVYCADLIWNKDYEKTPCQVEPATRLHVNSSQSIY